MPTNPDRAVLIEVNDRTVRDVERPIGLAAIYETLGVSCITSVPSEGLPEGDAIYADDEGFCNARWDTLWWMPGLFQPVIGNGLIVGTGPEGEDLGSTVRAADLAGRVVFARPFAKDRETGRAVYFNPTTGGFMFWSEDERRFIGARPKRRATA